MYHTLVTNVAIVYEYVCACVYVCVYINCKCEDGILINKYLHLLTIFSKVKLTFSFVGVIS